MTDGTASDTDTFVWTVGNSNQAPVFSTDITDQSDTEGDTVNLDANASDADLDTLTYSATGLPDGVSIDSGTGVISGTLSSTSSGVHNVTITVTDGTGSDTDTFTWTVANQNQAPVFSTDITDQSDAEGDSVSLDADATDADLDTLTYSATGLPDGVSIDSGTGVISGTLSGTSSGVHNVTITVTDGTATDTDTFTWTVANANTPPVVDSVTIGPASPTTNQTLTATVTSHDADGNPLTTAYQWTRNGTDIPGATGSTLNLATAGNGDKGDLIRVRVTVNDGTATSPAVISSPVTVVNTAPLATVGLSPASPSTTATLTATATKSDADADAVGLTFVWKVNGTTVRTFSSPTALTDTLNLATAGNGDPGDIVSVEVTPNDGTINGTLVSAQVTVAQLPRPPMPVTPSAARSTTTGAPPRPVAPTP